MLEADVRQNTFHGQLHVGALVVQREWRRLAPERGVRLDGELIGGNVRRAGAGRLANVRSRHVDALPRQAVHQVDVDFVERLERRRNRALGLVCGVNAPSAISCDREALHAMESDHAASRKPPATARPPPSGIRLDRDFAPRSRAAGARATPRQRVRSIRRERWGAPPPRTRSKGAGPQRRQVASRASSNSRRSLFGSAPSARGNEVANGHLARTREVDVERERGKHSNDASRAANLRGSHSITLSLASRCPVADAVLLLASSRQQSTQGGSRRRVVPQAWIRAVSGDPPRQRLSDRGRGSSMRTRQSTAGRRGDRLTGWQKLVVVASIA